MKSITGCLVGCLLLVTSFAHGAEVKRVAAKVDFGARKHLVTIVDSNANGAFGDSLRVLSNAEGIWAITPGDTLEIPDGKITAFYEQPVKVDGAWYQVTRAASGTITAKAVKLAVGKVQIDSAGWQGILIGKQYNLLLTGTRAEVALPADDYVLVSLLPQATTGSHPLGNPIYCNLSLPLLVAPGKSAQVMLNPTVTATTTATATADGQYSLAVKFKTTDPCA
ncbi:MAG TPA: hypothetical protein VGM23_11245, partial [Armatimonadota bacterium]